MSNEFKKKYEAMSAQEKRKVHFLLGSICLFIIYLYVVTLQHTLYWYTKAYQTLLDIIVDPSNFTSLPFFTYSFFYSIFILLYPVVFVAAFTTCILYIKNWQQSTFAKAFYFPAVFTFITVGFAFIGRILS